MTAQGFRTESDPVEESGMIAALLVSVAAFPFEVGQAGLTILGKKKPTGDESHKG